MENILGQLQFRLDDAQVTYYTGEQCLRDIVSINSVMDGNQTEFVFVHNVEGKLFYFVSNHDVSLNQKVIDLNVTGSSFHVIHDERGFLVLMIVQENRLFVVRQHRYRPGMFEIPILAYEGEGAISALDIVNWRGAFHLALIVEKGIRSLLFGTFGDEVELTVWGSVSRDATIQWNTESELHLDVIENETIEEIYLTLPRTNQIVHRDQLAVSNYLSCPSKHGPFEAFGLVRLNAFRKTLFSGYQNNVWYALSGIQDIVVHRSRYYEGKYHIVLLDRIGVVYYVVIDNAGKVTQRVLDDLGLIKSIDLVMDQHGLKVYAVDQETDMIHVLTMICPDRGWSILPLILYYQPRYRIRIVHHEPILDQTNDAIVPQLLPGWNHDYPGLILNAVSAC